MQDQIHPISLAGAQRPEHGRGYEASMIQTMYRVQSSAFQLLNNCYIPSHLYFMTDKPGDDVNMISFKSKKTKY